MTLTLRYAARSDRGLIRGGNQDSVYAGPRLLAVADGMGGMAAGDVASNIVIAAMAPLDEDVPGNAVIDALRGAVDHANQQIRDTVEANPAMEGMGTTLTAMLFGGSKFGMVHIGDSRAYLLRDGEFGQVTKDDTYVQMLVDEGRISLEEADTHPQRHLLFRALDGRDAEPEYSVRQATAGDRYLLCSDGLSSVVSAETIESTLREYTNPDQCAERLVQLALRGGGPDNITVIIADVTDEDIVEEAPIVGGAAARDRGNSTSADSSTPAARASALTAPRPAAPEAASDEDDDDDRPRRHPALTALLLVVLVGLLGGGVWFGWRYTQSQYYVGATEDGVIAVFRGVPGQVAGLRLSSEEERSATTLDELTKTAQDAVKQGIPASNVADARRKLTQLTSDDPTNSNKLPECQPSASAQPSGASQDPSTAPSTTPSAGPTADTTPSAGPTADTTPTPLPTISCRNR
ncbi:protein phosphatase [Planosporangium flavigriseum]|uniref:Serine/threonine protein phosphatase PstP n=1 Tax=Planosporangium flavigriseum TaxID=373681 RepID=A0A8J3LIT4_9ACTN|nr:PP2C family serine/threonine-protein phosphatase [Planosporangium flavigriseum]NJC64420.1 protein phosphatase [Planosporangium flavigriseum]GIG72104.1 protein phosphatase [Planosporangium flavigriseum]